MVNCCCLGMFCVNASIYSHFIQSQICRVHVWLSVSCHLHFLQNDRFWRRKGSCRSYWESNQTPSYHESIALPLSYPAPTCVNFLLLSISQSKLEFRFYSDYFGHYRIKASHRQIWATRRFWQTDSVCLSLKALMMKPGNLFQLFLFLCVCVCVCAHACAHVCTHACVLNLFELALLHKEAGHPQKWRTPNLKHYQYSQGLT